MSTQDHTQRRQAAQTRAVACGLLLLLLGVVVAEDPHAVVPRGSTILGESHLDPVAKIEVPMPVGWQSDPNPVFGSTEIVPADDAAQNKAMILAGPLDSHLAAAAIADDRGAATALAETVQVYVLGAHGDRDEQRDVAVDNEVGSGHATSYVVSPTDTDSAPGGLVYAAVFGSGSTRTWVAYVSRTPSSSPEPRWVDRIVHEVTPVKD